MDDYRAVNLANWEQRAPAHAASPDYGFDRFIADPDYLSDVVAFDRPRLGDLDGLRGVHLQCHIGTDTLSLARLGARVTGLDFSPPALEQARMLARTTGSDTDFVESDVYGAPEVLPPGGFDLVYTGIGALCWLPDIRRWAAVVAELLRPGGRLFIREGHPMLWALDDERDDGVLVATVVCGVGPWWRLACAVGFAVLAPSLFDGLTTWDVSALGHLTALVVGVVAGVVFLLCARPASGGATSEPGV